MSENIANAKGKAERAFALNLDALNEYLNTLEDRNITYRRSLESELAKRSYRFIDHMISKIRKGNLSAEHREQLLRIDFSYNGKSIRQVLDQQDVSMRSVEGVLLSYAERRAKEAMDEAERTERQASQRILTAKQEIETAERAIKEAQQRAQAASEYAKKIHEQLARDYQAVVQARVNNSIRDEYVYLTTEEIAERLRYDVRSLRESVAKNLCEGIHWVRAPGGRRKLFIWNNIERDMLNGLFAECQD